MDRLPAHILADVADLVPWLGRTMPAWLHANHATASSLLRIMRLHGTAGLPAKCVADIRVFAPDFGVHSAPRKTCLFRHVLLGAAMSGRLSLCRFLLPFVLSGFELARELDPLTPWMSDPGNAKTLSWVFVLFKEHFFCKLLGAATRHGHLHICRWLHCMLNLLSTHAYKDTPWAHLVPKTDLHDKIHILVVTAATRGHLELCQWLHTTFQPSNEEALRNRDSLFFGALKAGHVHICQWVHDTLSLSEFSLRNCASPIILSQLCARGHANMAVWLQNTFLVPFQNLSLVTLRDMLRHATENGHLAMCQWVLQLSNRDVLRDVPAFPDHSVVVNDDTFVFDLMSLSVQRGHVGVFTFLLGAPSTCSVDRVDDLVLVAAKSNVPDAIKVAMCDAALRSKGDQHGAKPDYTQALKEASSHGDLALCQWLYVRSSSTHWASTEADARIFELHGKLFMRALSHGHISVAAWLDSMQLSIRNPYKLTCMFRDMVNNGHLDACKWVYEQCDYSGEFSGWIFDRLHNAMLKARVDICMWLTRTFPVDAALAWNTYANSGKMYRIVKRGDVRMCCWLIDLITSMADTRKEHAVGVGVKKDGLDPVTTWAYEEFWVELRGSFVTHYFPNRATPLELAAKLGYLDMCRWITHHYPGEVRDAVSTAFRHAVESDHLAVCRHLYPMLKSEVLAYYTICRDLYLETRFKLSKPTRLWLFLVLQQHKSFRPAWPAPALQPLFERGDWDVCLYVLGLTSRWVAR